MNYHQGDVFLRRIEKIPAQAKFVRKNVVAYGEITGHKHQIVDSMFYELDGKSYLKVTSENPMTHEEHPATEKIKSGDYEVVIQQEYFPDGFTDVKD